MPVADTVAYGRQLAAQMGDRPGAKAFAHTEHLVFHQGADSF